MAKKNSNKEKINYKAEIIDKYFERIKYLMNTKVNDLSEEDKIHKILIKIVTEPYEYHLLRVWCMNEFTVQETKLIMGLSTTELENKKVRTIIKIKDFIWNDKNNPFEENEKIKENKIKKNDWIGDRVLEGFLNTDIIMTTPEEYIDTVSNRF